MSHRKTNHYLSALVAIFFLLLAAGSVQVNKIHCGAFDRRPSGELESQGFIEMNDGSKVFGDDISWKNRLIGKDEIKVDGQKFLIRETRGYYSGKAYYYRVNNQYIQRIIHGKINVYFDEREMTTTSTSSTGAISSTTRIVCSHYAQVGDRGPLVPIASQKDIKPLVKDCPRALEMISKTNRQLRRSIRKERDYLNQVFIIYNNNCH